MTDGRDRYREVTDAKGGERGVAHFIDRHFREHQRVVDASLATLAPAIAGAGQALVAALLKGGKVICFGNGGSAAEASHFAEELVGRYSKSRQPFPAVSLTADGPTVTCVSNDFGYEKVFERQVEALVRQGDVAVALTTSGRSENVNRALSVAKQRGGTTIAMTGSAGLPGAQADYVLSVPSDVAALVQEVHLIIIHLLCQAVDDSCV